MNVKISGLSQDLSFESGSFQNYVVLELPNGRRIRANIEADAAQELTTLFVQTRGSSAERAIQVANGAGGHAHDVEIESLPKQGQFAPVELAEFGGDYGNDVAPAAPPPIPSALPAQSWTPVPKLVTRPLIVQADAAGNPVIQGEGLVDPLEIVGGNLDGEEDAGQV